MWLTIIGLLGNFVALILPFLKRPTSTEQPLPQVKLYEWPLSPGDCYFRLVTDHGSIGWTVIRVEVDDADFKDCIDRDDWVQGHNGVRYYGPTGKWRSACDYSEDEDHDYMPLLFHPACPRVLLTVVCRTPDTVRKPKQFWRKDNRMQKLPFVYERGTHIPAVNDRLTQTLLGHNPFDQFDL